MVDNPATSDRGLLRVAYADSTQLATRASLYDHQQPSVDLVGRALDGLPLPAPAHVLDVGCGYGRFVERLLERADVELVVGADLSGGMVREGRATVADVRASWVGADAQRVPFRDESFDAVLAMHMLYHVPDIERAIAEARRVLRAGATFLVSTPGNDHLRPLYELMTDVAGVSLPGINDRFEPERGALLEAVFDRVELEWLRTEVVLTDPGPAVAFVESTRSLREPLLPASTPWDDLIADVRTHIAAQIQRAGEYRLPSEVAVFRCR